MGKWVGQLIDWLTIEVFVGGGERRGAGLGVGLVGCFGFFRRWMGWEEA